MADPASLGGFGEIIEKVGLGLAAILGLFAVLKWLSLIHLKALNDRITTLELVVKERDGIIAKREEKIDSLQASILAATVGHGHDMRSLALQLLDNDKANRDFMRAHQNVVIKLVETLGGRPCMMEDYKPHPHHHPKTPVPDLPQVPETDRTTGRA